MPNFTIYVKTEDEQLFKQAAKMLRWHDDTTISRFIADNLREYVESKQGKE